MATIGGSSVAIRSVRFSDDLQVAPASASVTLEFDEHESDKQAAKQAAVTNKVTGGQGHATRHLSNNLDDAGDEMVNSLYVSQLPSLYDDAAYVPYDIYTAASIGDAVIVEKALKACFPPNSQNSSGWSALMYAAYLGHESICAMLIKFGANVNLCNNEMRTALMLASACGNLSVVRLLMKNGAEIDKQDRDGDTALAHATLCSQTSVVEALLEAEADPNLPNKAGTTPTLSACSIGHELTLLALLQNDGNPRSKNAKGEDGEALASECSRTLSILKDPPKSKRLKRRPKSTGEIKSLAALLAELKLEKYQAIFDAENIDLNLFLKLSEADIIELGIKAFGPRKKMMNVIQHYRTDGTILLYNEDTDAKPVTQNSRTVVSGNSDQITTELMECQQQLSICQQKLNEARATIQMQHADVSQVTALCEEARDVARSMLEEIRRTNSQPLKNNLELLIRNIESIFMKLIELPTPSQVFQY